MELRSRNPVSRREVLRVFGVASLGVLVAACAPQERIVEVTKVVQQQVIVTATPQPAAPATLRFAHAMGDEGQPIFSKIADNFHAANPRITVKVEPTFDWDVQKYLVQAASGTAPDIVWGDEHFSYNLSSKGALLDLNPFMQQSNFRKDDYAPLFQYFAYAGKQYSIALWYGTYVLLYNKKLFDDVKVAYPTVDWTYDDLVVAAKAITRATKGGKEPDVWGFLAQTTWANPWGALIWAWGGKYYNDDGTQFLLTKKPNYDGLQWYIDLIHKQKVAPPPETATALAGGGDPFTLGVIGMKAVSAVGTVNYRKVTEFGWDVAPMPKGPKGRFSVVTTDSLSIYKQSKEPDAAWQFIQALLTDDAAKSYVNDMNGPVPGVKSAVKYFAQSPNPPAHRQYFIDAIDYANVPMQSPFSYVVETPFYQALGAATSGLKSLDEAMSGVGPAIDKVLDEEIKKVLSYSG